MESIRGDVISDRPAPPTMPWFVRWIGAGIGAALGGSLLALVLYLAPQTWASGSDPFALIAGAGGLLDRLPELRPVLVALGAACAGLAGLIFGPAAARSVEWTGLWMGAATYGLAIGSVALTVDTLSILPDAPSPIDIVGAIARAPLGVLGSPLVLAIAGAALAPLLAVAFVAGPAWALMVRLAVGQVPATAPRSLPIWPVLACAALAFLGWSILGAITTALSSIPAGLD